MGPNTTHRPWAAKFLDETGCQQAIGALAPIEPLKKIAKTLAWPPRTHLNYVRAKKEDKDSRFSQAGFWSRAQTTSKLTIRKILRFP